MLILELEDLCNECDCCRFRKRIENQRIYYLLYFTNYDNALFMATQLGDKEYFKDFEIVVCNNVVSASKPL